MKRKLTPYFATALVAVACSAWLAAGCTKNIRAKEFGGTMATDIPAGQKLVMVTWKDSDLWLLYRPMHSNEAPETYILKEQSTFGVWSGTVTIRESR